MILEESCRKILAEYVCMLEMRLVSKVLFDNCFKHRWQVIVFLKTVVVTCYVSTSFIIIQ